MTLRLLLRSRIGGRCFCSSTVLRVRSALALITNSSHTSSAADSGTSYNLITVQTGRAVSNEASAILHLHHESPQAILVRNGHSVWNASHGEITAPALDQAIRRID